MQTIDDKITEFQKSSERNNEQLKTYFDEERKVQEKQLDRLSELASAIRRKFLNPRNNEMVFIEETISKEGKELGTRIRELSKDEMRQYRINNKTGSLSDAIMTSGFVKDIKSLRHLEGWIDKDSDSTLANVLRALGGLNNGISTDSVIIKEEEVREKFGGNGIEVTENNTSVLDSSNDVDELQNDISERIEERRDASEERKQNEKDRKQELSLFEKQNKVLFEIRDNTKKLVMGANGVAVASDLTRNQNPNSFDISDLMDLNRVFKNGKLFKKIGKIKDLAKLKILTSTNILKNTAKTAKTTIADRSADVLNKSKSVFDNALKTASRSTTNLKSSTAESLKSISDSVHKDISTLKGKVSTFPQSFNKKDVAIEKIKNITENFSKSVKDSRITNNAKSLFSKAMSFGNNTISNTSSTLSNTFGGLSKLGTKTTGALANIAKMGGGVGAKYLTRGVPILGALATGADAYFGYNSDMEDIQAKVASGELSEKDAKKEKTLATGKNIGKGIGGTLGALGGSILGPVGSLVGSFIGEQVGGFIGKGVGHLVNYVSDDDEPKPVPKDDTASNISSVYDENGKIQVVEYAPETNVRAFHGRLRDTISEDVLRKSLDAGEKFKEDSIKVSPVVQKEDGVAYWKMLPKSANKSARYAFELERLKAESPELGEAEMSKLAEENVKANKDTGVDFINERTKNRVKSGEEYTVEYDHLDKQNEVYTPLGKISEHEFDKRVAEEYTYLRANDLYKDKSDEELSDIAHKSVLTSKELHGHKYFGDNDYSRYIASLNTKEKLDQKNRSDFQWQAFSDEKFEPLTEEDVKLAQKKEKDLGTRDQLNEWISKNDIETAKRMDGLQMNAQAFSQDQADKKVNVTVNNSQINKTDNVSTSNPQPQQFYKNEEPSWQKAIDERYTM